MKKTITLFGFPGSGKSTQAQKLIDKYGFEYISAGNLFRQRAKQNDRIAKELAALMKRGDLIPDEIVNQLFYERLSSVKKDLVLLDNYPVNPDQMKGWQKITEDYDFGPIWAVVIDLQPDKIVRRLKKRLHCPVCQKVFIEDGETKCPDCGKKLVERADDKVETIKNRIEEYREPITYSKKHFRNQGKLIEINGDQSIEEVFSDLDREVSKIIND